MLAVGGARVVRTGLLAALCAVMAVPVLSAAAPGPVCAEGAFAAGRWVQVTAPSFPSGGSAVVDYVVAAGDARRLYVTNGIAVMSSTDGGCRWRTALAAPPVRVAGVGQRITHLAMSAADPDTVYAALAADPVSRPAVLRTEDGGKTWAAADAGLELVQGRPLQITVAPGEPDIAYLVVEGNRLAQGDVSAEVSRTLYATTDGRSWEQRDAAPLLVDRADDRVGPVRVGANATFAGVAVDARNARVVWLYGGFGLWRSTDGAMTSARVIQGQPDPSGVIGAVDVHRGLQKARVLAFGGISQVAYASFDGGRRFSKIPTPSIVRSSATGPTPDELAVATDTRVFYQPATGAASRQITPAGPSVQDLQSSRSPATTFYARSGAAVLRWVAPKRPGQVDAPPVPVKPGKPGEVTVPQLPPLPKPTLRGPTAVTIPAGGSATLPYHLLLPGVQRVDVYFLVDVSDSMAEEINGLRSALAGIVTELVASHVDAHFGVGRYNTYDTEPYFRVTPITAPGPRLERALENLVAGSGGVRKSQLEALYQTATGAGRSGDDFVAAGQQAGFRPEVPLRLVLHATDEPFYEQAPSPSYRRVAESLRASGAKQLGLAFESGDLLPRLGPGPEAGLRRVATDTGALAPEGGVDCDGDATADIAAGAPLVCQLPSERSAEATLLANAIVNLVRSLPNRGSVEFSVAGGDGNPLRPRSSRQRFEVDFKDTTRRSVELTYTCPAVEKATTYDYTVGVATSGSTAAEVTTAVRCMPAARPPATPGGIPPAAVIAPGVVGVLPPPPPPPPISQPHSNPQPLQQPNAQGQAQAVGQGALAPEEEEQQQHQLARVEVLGDEEYAMTGLLIATAVVSAVGCAAVTRTRRVPAWRRAD